MPPGKILHIRPPLAHSPALPSHAGAVTHTRALPSHARARMRAPTQLECSITHVRHVYETYVPGVRPVFMSHYAPRNADSKVIVTHHAPGHIPSPLLDAIGATPNMGFGRFREIRRLPTCMCGI